MGGGWCTDKSFLFFTLPMGTYLCNGNPHFLPEPHVKTDVALDLMDLPATLISDRDPKQYKKNEGDKKQGRREQVFYLSFFFINNICIREISHLSSSNEVRDSDRQGCQCHNSGARGYHGFLV